MGVLVRYGRATISCSPKLSQTLPNSPKLFSTLPNSTLRSQAPFLTCKYSIFMSFQFVPVCKLLSTVANLRLGRMDASLVVKETFPRGERLVLRALTTSEVTIVIFSRFGRSAGEIFCNLKATQYGGGFFTANLHFNLCVSMACIYTIWWSRKPFQWTH